MPQKRHPSQAAPASASATGKVTNAPRTGDDPRAQGGEFLTTMEGVRLPDTDHSLKAGNRGPTLMDDFHLREKITHFDHERIPERVVHARGAAAHGTFTAYGNAASVTRAAFLQENVETPVFVRFSTVLGSRGSADTVRDVRGFATKFYTDEGNFDLVGNNMPVFFIQDGIKFPDIIHAGKPHPDREIPQAQTAHDTFWDFVGLHTEATHHVMWGMSDRAIPRSYRTMEGFGVHTFRLVNARGRTSLVKFHWKPVAGVHGLVWEEAQIAAGVDPDYHRRDMYDAIGAGVPLEYELGIQVMPDSEDQTFEGIDLLDPTKLVPEELCEVQLIGRMTLDRNPTNYFAEVEQVAFHTGNLVPGIEVTDDPLMQARLFSYLDTQLSRLGGPNFTQLPINRPHCPVNDMLRDGMHQTAIHKGVAPYLPNSLDGGEPRVADAKEAAYVHQPRAVTGSKVRESPVSFSDHFTQAAMFYRSMSEVEQAHIVEAYTFELGKCAVPEVRERYLGVLANVDADLCRQVAGGLGLPAPKGKPPKDVTLSPALSMVSPEPGPIAGRVVGVLATEDSDLAGITRIRNALNAEGAVLRVLSTRGGFLGEGRNQQLIERTLLTTRSVEYDALLVADGAGSVRDLRLSLLIHELYRHCKALGAWGDGTDALEAAGVDLAAPGVVTAGKANDDLLALLVEALGRHRAWDRADLVLASPVPPAG
ncbi:MAG TPA: catalase [Mycobacteriales bacterium]|nr:catalase [Mycobacteriales bacterium]